MSTNPNPFAPQPSHTPPADASASSPFAPSMNQGDLGEGFDLPPCPVGVLRGHVTELKQFEKGKMLYVMCDDVNYPSKDALGIWLGNDMTMLKQIAASLGIVSEIRVDPATKQSKVYFTDSNGNKGFAAFKNKPGLFVYAPYNGEPSINKFGYPKKGSSPEWDQYAEEANFSEEQETALKRARGGVVPGDAHHLFT